MIFQIKAKIIKNIKIKQKYYKLTLNCSQIAKRAQPGQFATIKISDDYEPFLRRPFSIHRVIADKFEILYEVVGVGTEILSKKKPGEYLDVLGPLGNGFTFDERTIIVAGGMGVAPLVFLAKKLKEIPNPKSQIPNLVLLGARTKSQILCADEFQKLGCEVKIATDDGSSGFRGKVTELLKHLLRTPDSRLRTIYACGPRLMLKEVAKISETFKIRAYGSLEEHMACGIGACLGCVVNTKSGYQTVCKDGPVFDLSQIEFS